MDATGDEEKETLPGEIRRDASSGLPYLADAKAISRLVLAYLSLPYSVAEHGCGKKGSLIIEQLVHWDIPPWALSRGMVMEADMSPPALSTTDMHERPHALVVENPLHALGDLSNPTLREMLNAVHADVSIEDREIAVGRFVLHHEPKVQFVIARSHIYTIVTLWDDATKRAVDRVLDPTLVRFGLFPVSRVRKLVNAPEALLLTAPLGGRFRLSPDTLTEAQGRAVERIIGTDRSIADLSDPEHAELVRRLNGAEPGSIGDPETWTYANNISGGDDEHDALQRTDTGIGEPIRDHMKSLVEARQAHRTEVTAHRAALDAFVDQAKIRHIVQRDALWSERQLEPLARVAITLVYYRSLCRLAKTLATGGRIIDYLRSPDAHRPLRGLGVSMRRRIDRLAMASEDAQGRIDARALGEGHIACALETARQMNDAGLTVCVDSVGNLHGVLLEDDARVKFGAERTSLRELLRQSVMMGSHIDTVSDAGKFDGRLGVAAGIEVAQIIRDLERYCGVRFSPEAPKVRLFVTAFSGEEMTFTGHGVSMPGSAAVAARASPGVIHEMTNGAGERYGDRLIELLRALYRAQQAGSLLLANDFRSDEPAALSRACFEPEDFFTPHTYERHIEQGPMLDRLEVPIALASTIMGLHQEDFVLRGSRAEAAALEMVCRARELTHEAPFEDTRVTVGIFEPSREGTCHDRPTAAVRVVFEGEMNHAGATATPDRKDPLVAAGRLARRFHRWVDALREAGCDVQVLVGDTGISPGTNRNVIPRSAFSTLATSGASLDDTALQDLVQALRATAASELARPVSLGGEGIAVCHIDSVSFVNTASEVRLSIDVRDAESSTIASFREHIDDVCADLKRSYGVEIRSDVQQRVPPRPIEHSGQVLLVERSYGGSHNPNETEMTMDLTRGTILQLAVIEDVLGRRTLDGENLVTIVEGYLPARWTKRLRRFTSGALHDTCNISARVLESKRSALA